MSRLFRVHRVKLLAGAMSLISVACASVPPESLEQVKADRVLADKVQSAFDSDPEFFYWHPEIQAENGKVSLTGDVWSAPAIVSAERIASQVPGVTSVSDSLEVQRNNSNGGGSGGAR
jgi:osmotically-inducible protein OsmY